MTPDEVLALAQQGNPKVLSAILNRSTQSHGISVRVAQKQNDLHILLEGTTIDRSEALVTFIRDSLQKLKVDPSYAVKVYGRRRGQRSVAWNSHIDLQAAYSAVYEVATSKPNPQGASNPQLTNSLDDGATPETMASENHAASSGAEPSMINEPTDINPSPVSSEPVSSEEGIEVSGEMTADAAGTDESSASSREILSGDWQERSEGDRPNEEPPEVAPAPTPRSMETMNIASPPNSSPTFRDSPPLPMDTAAPSRTDASADEDALFDDSQEELFDFQSMMKRPEALVILIFAIVLYVWQLYTELALAAAPEGSVSGQELAKRLGVSTSTISRRKFQDDFSSWSASQDPDGIAWAYMDSTFIPQMPDFE